MDYAYALTPALAWLAGGILKFVVNSAKSRRPAYHLIGYGGMPSTHAAIVTSTAALIGLQEGVTHPAFGAAITFAFIVMLDAVSLRRQIGKHAEAINRLLLRQGPELRERMGHSPTEIAAGMLVGIAVAVIVRGFAHA